MADDRQGHSMDRELVSGERHELEYLARTHGTSTENVEKLIKELGTRSRRRIEEELDKRYVHQSRSGNAHASEAAGREGVRRDEKDRAK